MAVSTAFHYSLTLSQFLSTAVTHTPFPDNRDSIFLIWDTFASLLQTLDRDRDRDSQT